MTNKKPTRITREEMRERALEAFVKNTRELSERLEEMRAFVNDHMGLDPDDVTWGDAELAKEVNARMTALADFVFHRGEYAE